MSRDLPKSALCRLSPCRLFIVPSAVHLMLRFSAVLSATTALCERASIFISASWVLKDKYYIVFIILAQKNKFVKPFLCENYIWKYYTSIKKSPQKFC